MHRKLYCFSILILLLCSSASWAQGEPFDKKESLQGKPETEGSLSLYPQEAVSSEGKEEKTFHFRVIESINLEKVNAGILGANLLSGEESYSVGLRNRQEILSLKKKYSLTLNTEMGVVVRKTDPGTAQSLLHSNSPSGGTTTGSLAGDKRFTISLEFKF
jgi:hypothetical protein